MGQRPLIRNFALLAALILFAGSGVIHSTAATKAGAPCTKAGKISISGGKKFTCIKSGKELIWNKGVATKPAPNKTPTAATSPSPSPSTASPSPSATIEELIYPTSKEVEILDRLVENAFKTAQPKSADVDFQIGPGQESAEIGLISKAVLDQALRAASILDLDINIPIKIYVGNRDWLTPKMPAGTWCADPIIGAPGSGSAGFCGIENGVIFMSVDGFLEESGQRIKRDFSKGADRFLISYSFAHEIFHLIQGVAAQKYANTKGFYNPFWLNEGGANFGAMMTQAVIFQVPFSTIRIYIASYSSCVIGSKPALLKDFITNAGQRDNCGPYYYGYLWSEYLVAKTGDIGALTNLAKADSTVASALFYDPAKEFEYNEKKLALSLKTIYQLDFEDFVTGAQRYSDSATSQFDAWLKAGKPLLPK
jgi:hypothetical protein